MAGNRYSGKQPFCKLTPEQRQIAIETYARMGTFLDAARACGANRGNILNCMKDKAFKAAMADAREAYADRLEGIADERIADGKDKASGILLIFRLKALRPDIYREQIQHKVDTTVKVISGVPRPGDKVPKKRPGRPPKNNKG